MSFPYFDAHTHSKPQNHSAMRNIVNWDYRKTPETPDSPFSAGIHPWWIESSSKTHQNTLKTINQAVDSYNCVAIGETGLDRHFAQNSQIDIEAQLKVLSTHMSMAEESAKPLIVHCVRAVSDLLWALKNNSISSPVIIHDYNGSQEDTEQLLKKANIHFSYGRKLWDEKSGAYKSLLHIPGERLFFETDDMDTSIQEVYLKASSLLEMTEQNLKEMIYDNARRVFPSIFEKDQAS